MAEGKEKEEYRRFQNQRTQNSVSISWCTEFHYVTNWAGSITNSTLMGQFFCVGKSIWGQLAVWWLTTKLGILISWCYSFRYLLFAQKRRKELIIEKPGYTFAEITVIMGREWTVLDPDIKVGYVKECYCSYMYIHITDHSNLVNPLRWRKGFKTPAWGYRNIHLFGFPLSLSVDM